MDRAADTIIIGLGITGLSCARYFGRLGIPFTVVDTRSKPPGLKALRAEMPGIECVCGALDSKRLIRAKTLVVSPGISVSEPAIKAAVDNGSKIISDIDLFCDAVDVPIVAITGSNAKSTVTTLVGQMAERAGKSVGVGGNLGVPVLDMLEQGPRELYVLELSSFQLDITERLRAEVATVLNVSPDHMDRYASVDEYRRAKHRIFKGCHQIVNNLEDPQLPPMMLVETRVSNFGLAEPADEGCFGVTERDGRTFLALGHRPLIAVDELKIKGSHNISNALAALALGSAVDLPMQEMLLALGDFDGLPHRCQWVRNYHGVDYYNDSKGTNVGATSAALTGLGGAIDGRIVLIAGGVGKGADFAGLRTPIIRFCRSLVVMGESAEELARLFDNRSFDGSTSPENLTSEEIVRVNDMQQAVRVASEQAQVKDAVLLSPACASFDMFENFEARGDAFVAEVMSL